MITFQIQKAEVQLTQIQIEVYLQILHLTHQQIIWTNNNNNNKAKETKEKDKAKEIYHLVKESIRSNLHQSKYFQLQPLMLNQPFLPKNLKKMHKND